MLRFAIVAIALTSPAFAAPAPGTATLGAPTAKAMRVVAETGAWRCEGSRCSGPADTVTRVAVAACTAVADRAGRVTAFSVGSLAFGDADLARCNRNVK